MKKFISFAVCALSLLHITTIFTNGDASKVAKILNRGKTSKETLANWYKTDQTQPGFFEKKAGKWSITRADYEAWKGNGKPPKGKEEENGKLTLKQKAPQALKDITKASRAAFQAVAEDLDLDPEASKAELMEAVLAGAPPQ